MTETPESIILVYDGDCPFCSATAHMYRLKQAVGALSIVNAREAFGTPLMTEIQKRGMDLNEGVVVRFGSKLYHGAEALHVLALLGSETGWLNKLNVSLFRNRATARLYYPFLKGIRNFFLWLLGKKPI
ncbi:MAG TPA: DCC1-like thiol-disulfide oxidoreductase family protein [Asticcacaulis sp.]|nr:DCC1-like thiol-disulfide oxidoreductase family protein [Asticcacaulis sp.]